MAKYFYKVGFPRSKFDENIIHVTKTFSINVISIDDFLSEFVIILSVLKKTEPT